MKRILFLASLDLNRRDGGALATLGYYNAFCQLYPGKVDIALPHEDCKGRFENAIAIPKRGLSDVILGSPIHRGYNFIKKYVRLHSGEYSICVINISRTAGDLMDEFKKAGMKTVVIHHNYEVEYTMSNKHIYTFGGKFPYLVAKVEGEAYRKADVNLFLTDSDLKSISEAYGATDAKNFVTGVFEHEKGVYVPSKSKDPNTMVFTGSMCDYQTYYSANLFEINYFDRLVKDKPQIRLILAGRNPHPTIWEFQKHYPENITVIANPASMDEVVDQASIFLCPTYIGSGIKLRVMDGLRKGLPILVHNISARGYEKFYGKPYFQVFHDYESFELGLKRIMEYLNSNEESKKDIIQDYKNSFAFETGLKRVEAIISLLD